MGRAQLRLELISNEKARVAAFGKRKKSLEKAAHELSTLCGVDIGMVVYFPAQNYEANQPTIWPKDGHELLTSLIHSYKSRSGYDCRRSSTYNLSDFFKDQTERTQEELKKLRKKVRAVKYPKWDERYNCSSGDQLKEIVSLLNAKIDAVSGRINSEKSSGTIYTESGASMDPSVQENAVFRPSMWTDIMQQQHPLAYCDDQAIVAYQRWTMMMNNGAPCSQNTFSFGQNTENAVSVPSMWTDIMQQQQPLACYDAQANIEDQRWTMMMNYGSSCSQNTFSFGQNPENSVSMPSMWTDIMQQQQPLAYYDTQANIADQRWTMMMNNGASCSQNTFSFDQNPENSVSMPSMRTDIMQQQQPLAYYDAQANIADQRRMMMKNNGASCSQNKFSFDDNPDNYPYSCDENSGQNCGMGIMENIGANNGELLISCNVPNMAPMPQNRQRLLLSSAFPQMQAALGKDYVQRRGS
ncbi:UNVERIFIED_CONTAM: hypothetical protein Sangu_1088300 [Sesamum angustifolium]|uniref:MADS-box domain-containing protein n=1 Tax=Sesamum angustifolium TaxID=2727405 RepID=A0AAW2NYB1_9LAMI